MTSNRPLPYPALEYVLQYMSVDLRMAVSKSCPALRNFDNKIPLRIQKLSVYKSQIDINDNTVVYRIGVIKIYSDETPPDVLADNNRGGSTDDIAVYGKSEEENQRVSAERIESLETEIRQQQNRLNYQLGGVRTPAIQQRIKDLRNEIEEVRKNGYIPPYTLYLQLIVNSKYERTVERFEYTESLPTATKYLFGKLFPENNLVLVDTFQLIGSDVSLPRPPRCMLHPIMDMNVRPLNGLEAELHIISVLIDVADFVNIILGTEFRSEKLITAFMGTDRREEAMQQVRAAQGAQMNKTPGHVIVPNGEQFKITFYSDEGDELHAKVERK